MVTREAAADARGGNGGDGGNGGGGNGGNGDGNGDFDFSGKTAVVTGAARGIGLAIARRFAAAAARVVVADVQPPPTPESSGDAGLVFHRADVSCETQVRGLFDYAVDKFGGVDILVNNAGVAVEARLEDTAVADWERVFAVNARGVFLCAKHALRAMNQRGGRRGAELGRGGAGQNGTAETTAAIINIGSIEARAANPLHAAYAASKGAVHSFTRSVALEYGARGIRCNAVAPGWIDTPFNDAFIARQPDPRGLRAALRGLHPLGRTGAPDDIADVVLWLASDAARFVTGQVVVVDGGRTARLPLPGATVESPAAATVESPAESPVAEPAATAAAAEQ